LAHYACCRIDGCCGKATSRSVSEVALARRPLIGSSPSPGYRAANGRVRTTKTIERLHEEFKRRIKTRTVLQSAETASMLFWALLAAGQITMRKADGWQTLAQKLADEPIDLAA
jgi:hypothetical protein